ncbi:MAG: MarR family transcriptional regulator [Candidatus Omnitrophota bacterium]
MNRPDSVDVFARELSEIFPQVIRGVMSRETHALARGKITAPQYLVLELLHSQGPSKMSCLAEEFRVSSPAMSGLVDRLFKMNVVKRVYGEKDRRVIRIELTAKGKKLAEEISRQKQKMIKEFFGQLAEKDRRDYLRILKKIRGLLFKAASPKPQAARK